MPSVNDVGTVAMTCFAVHQRGAYMFPYTYAWPIWGLDFFSILLFIILFFCGASEK